MSQGGLRLGRKFSFLLSTTGRENRHVRMSWTRGFANPQILHVPRRHISVRCGRVLPSDHPVFAGAAAGPCSLLSICQPAHPFALIFCLSHVSLASWRMAFTSEKRNFGHVLQVFRGMDGMAV
jgi:membrane-associated phospholipid phosphatase